MARKLFGAIIGLALLLVSSGAVAETVVGRASVIDADTLDIQGERIRLLDIDAPEGLQTCTRPDGTEWQCGQHAVLRLSEWIGDRVVSCKTERKDANNQWLARCEAGGEDLAQWLSSRGWAVPYRECKCEIIRAASEDAKLLKLGVWSGTFAMPWDWRKAH